MFIRNGHCDEIADELYIPRGTVKSHVYPD